MGFKSNRVIWILLTVFLVASLLVGCNRSATQPDEVEETTTEQESEETPAQTMVTPTAQTESEEPVATTEEPTEEPVPTEEPTEPAETTEPAPEPTEPPAEEPTPVEEGEPEPVAEQTYVVMPGDTLFSIAQSYGLTVEELAARNGIVNVNVLEVGQQLVIPVEGSEPPEAPVSGEQTYVVQPGDNLFRIALRYNMSFETVAAYNNIPWPYFVYVGQEIKIPPVQ